MSLTSKQSINKTHSPALKIHLDPVLRPACCSLSTAVLRSGYSPRPPPVSLFPSCCPTLLLTQQLQLTLSKYHSHHFTLLLTFTGPLQPPQKRGTHTELGRQGPAPQCSPPSTPCVSAPPPHPFWFSQLQPHVLPAALCPPGTYDLRGFPLPVPPSGTLLQQIATGSLLLLWVFGQITQPRRPFLTTSSKTANPMPFTQLHLPHSTSTAGRNLLCTAHFVSRVLLLKWLVRCTGHFPHTFLPQ